ncbi:MAG: L-threonylcarbamoyladenylate synthase [Gammaproteobacteria bacterium]|nr:L-threonylcarbamoyladenylate synthase [Gammaproteobacteria bacterium]
MSQYFVIHASHPQQRLLSRAAGILEKGGLVVYPTDTTYALGCHIGDKAALDRIRQVRRLDKQHHFTLTCRDLSEVSAYARVDNANYRVLRRLTPGPFTFLLQASREVPRRLVHPRRRTIGLRIPGNAVARELLENLGQPMMTTTMRLPGHDTALTDAQEIRDVLENTVDLIIDGGSCGVVPTTVVDLTGEAPLVTRQGLGVLD